MSDIQIVQKDYHAEAIFELKTGDMLFYLLAINYIDNTIEYRRYQNYGHNEMFFGLIDDIKMCGEAAIAWRNIKINKLVN